MFVTADCVLFLLKFLNTNHVKFRKQKNSLHLILSRSVKQKKQTKESPGWCVWAMIPNETYLTLYKWLAEAYQLSS